MAVNSHGRENVLTLLGDLWVLNPAFNPLHNE